MKASRVLKRKAPRIADHAEANGWEILEGRNGKGHIVMVHKPTGRRYTTASTPSDHRGEKNAVAWMKRIEKGLT